MYGSCLFCHASLGRNESLEVFPVGRRLAFDAALGRLWVVCRSCQQWNLSPLEERWEAIEACERSFRDTRLRVSTEHIGLARLPEGLELVRIGRPLRPEFAAWRYGDQFGRRRTRAVGTAVAGLGLAGGLYFGGVLAGGFGLWMLYALARNSVRGDPDKVVARVPHRGDLVKLKRGQLAEVRFEGSTEYGWQLVMPLGKKREGVLHGEEAMRMAGRLLPTVNRYGGTRTDVQRAVGELERELRPDRYFHTVATSPKFSHVALPKLPAAVRLAIEMAAHEETERWALEGELAALEESWRHAEEIAGIADSLLLPNSVVRAWQRLRGG